MKIDAVSSAIAPHLPQTTRAMPIAVKLAIAILGLLTVTVFTIAIFLRRRVTQKPSAFRQPLRLLLLPPPQREPSPPPQLYFSRPIVPELLPLNFSAALVKVLGGAGKFNQLPILSPDKVQEKDYQVDDRRKYLSIDPQEMTAPVMIGNKGSHLFVSMKYKDTAGKVSVDVIFLRAVNHWYLNDERSPLNFELPLTFLEKLIAGTHKYYELVT